MSELQVFSHQGFGQVRTLSGARGEPLFCASDIARALGYSNPHKAVGDHCLHVTKHIITDRLGRQQETSFIPEGDVQRLISQSQLPDAKRGDPGDHLSNQKFGQVRWIEKNDSLWFMAAEECTEIPGKGITPYHGYVYALEYGDGIKIGCTQNLKARIKTLSSNAKNYSNLSTRAFAYTKEHTNFKANELRLHQRFSKQRIGRSERFSLSLYRFLSDCPELLFLDNSAELAHRSQSVITSLKSFITGGK